MLSIIEISQNGWWMLYALEVLCFRLHPRTCWCYCRQVGADCRQVQIV